MSEYEERQAARRKRYLARAEAAAESSAAAQENARMMLAEIPQGQPILVGHHSERGHRAHLRRIDRAFRRAADDAGRAEHYRAKAEAVGSAGVSADDPEAVAKLKRKLLALGAEGADMKAINAAWRKAGKPDPHDLDAWTRMAEGMSEERRAGMERARVVLIRFPHITRPFPPYAIANLSANMRRVRKRIEELAARDPGAEPETLVCGAGVRIETRPEINRIACMLEEKPGRKICQVMYHDGWRWNPGQEAWTRALNDAGRAAATRTAAALRGEPT